MTGHIIRGKGNFIIMRGQQYMRNSGGVVSWSLSWADAQHFETKAQAQLAAKRVGGVVREV